MKRLVATIAVAALCAGLFGTREAMAQNIGDNVMLMFEADNANGFNTFPGAREYPVIDSSVALTVGAVPGAFTANNARNLQVVDSDGSGGFPFDDNFQDAGGTWTLNDPNFDVNDGLGEGLRINFVFGSNAQVENLINTNVLTGLIGDSFNAAQFGSILQWEIIYTPPPCPEAKYFRSHSRISPSRPVPRRNWSRSPSTAPWRATTSRPPVRR